VGEDSALSQATTVDLAALFAKGTVLGALKGAFEVSLTNNQNKSAIMDRRKGALKWHDQDGEKPKPWRSLPPLEYRLDRDGANSAASAVTLGPLEIKTFVLEF
jgi:hypothetical protein